MNLVPAAPSKLLVPGCFNLIKLAAVGIAFEITALVLLVALVGAVAMAKQHLDSSKALEEGADEERLLGGSNMPELSNLAS